MIAKSNRLQLPKGYAVDLPVESLPLPKHLYVPLTNARCSKAELSIKEGERVFFCQEVGSRHGPFFDQPILAPCSGTFLGLEKHGYRTGKAIDYLKFANDGEDALDPSVKTRSEQEIASLSQDELVALLQSHAAVGLGGSSFPSYIKMQTKEKIKTILVNGVECEPYITADYRALQQRCEEVIEALVLLQRIFDTEDARICIKKKHAELLLPFKRALAKYPGCTVTMQLLGSFYPQGWEVDMIRVATGIKVAPGRLPASYGILNFNVNSMIQLWHIVKYGMPVMEREINVNGEGILAPKTLRVRVGTPFSALIEACGGYRETKGEKTMIVGGAMMGVSLPNDDCITTPTVTSIVVNPKKEYREEPCVRCSSCVLSCPAHLHPVTVMSVMKTMPVDKQKIKLLHPERCMLCGLCSYVCTSRIRLTDYMRRAQVIAKLP